MKNFPHKILFYTDTPLYGGAEHQMYLLAKNLNPKQFEPIIVCRNQEKLLPWIEKFQKLNLKTYLINSQSKNSFANWSSLQKIIQQEKPALIHAHIWNPMACKYIYSAAKKYKIPLITTEHDPFKLNFFKNIYKKWTLQRVQKVITVSKANQELMQALYPAASQKIVTIHNGIETISPISEQKKQEIRKKIFATGPNNIVIFSAGTLHPRKGYKYLISAFKKISLKNPLAKLIIAGEGPERPFLENLIENLSLSKKVMLLGQRNDVTDLMQSSQIFVLPSLKEAFGLVILEAWASHLPVIASQVGGIPEIISAKNGLLIPPASKNELQKALLKLIKDQALRQELSQQGYLTLPHFSAQISAKNTEKIYLELLSNNLPN